MGQAKRGIAVGSLISNVLHYYGNWGLGYDITTLSGLNSRNGIRNT